MRAWIPPASILLIALLVPLLNMIPTWQGHLAESPPDRVFMGFRYMAGDHFQYASFIRQARAGGGLLMQNLFTTEPQRGAYIMLYYWTLGVFSRLTGASVEATWEIFRLVGGFLYIVVFWHFTAFYFKGGGSRIFATVIFAFAGGVDWIVTLLRVAVTPAVQPLEYPFDYLWNWSTFGAMLVPNWIWAGLMMLFVCHAMMRRGIAWRVISFVLPPLIWLMHHHSAMVVYLTFGLLPAAPLMVAAARLEKPAWDRVRTHVATAAPVIFSFALVAVYLIWARSDTVFRLNAAASFNWKIFFSVWWYPLSYGLLLPLAYYGMRATARDRGLPSDLLFSWLAASFFLSVNPLVGGAKYQYLMFPPLAMLAARGALHLKEVSLAARRVSKNVPVMACLGLMLFLDAPVGLFKDLPMERRDQDAYSSTPEIEAMQWLAGQPDGVVLCSYKSGHLIPWLTGKKVYIGHWFMTLNLNDKMRDVAYFFAPQVPITVKRDVLRRSGARYVFFGPAEAAGGSVDPSLPLRKVYDKSGVVIFEAAAAQ